MSTELPAAQHLDQLRSAAREIVVETRSLVHDLSDAQLMWRPAPEKWSIAECFEHLITLNGLYFPLLSDAIDAAPTSSESAYRPGWFERMFVRAVGPSGRAVRTSRVFTPPSASPSAPERFCDAQDTLVELLDRAHGRDLRRVKVTSPALSLLRLRADAALEMVVAHERRHLNQARTVRDDPSFPRPARSAMHTPTSH